MRAIIHTRHADARFSTDFGILLCVHMAQVLILFMIYESLQRFPARSANRSPVTLFRPKLRRLFGRSSEHEIRSDSPPSAWRRPLFGMRDQARISRSDSCFFPEGLQSVIARWFIHPCQWFFDAASAQSLLRGGRIFKLAALAHRNRYPMQHCPPAERRIKRFPPQCAFFVVSVPLLHGFHLIDTGLSLKSLKSLAAVWGRLTRRIFLATN